MDKSIVWIQQEVNSLWTKHDCCWPGDKTGGGIEWKLNHDQFSLDTLLARVHVWLFPTLQPGSLMVIVVTEPPRLALGGMKKLSQSP